MKARFLLLASEPTENGQGTFSTENAGMFVAVSPQVPCGLVGVGVCLGLSLTVEELAQTNVVILDVVGPSGNTAGFLEPGAIGDPAPSVEMIINALPEEVPAFETLPFLYPLVAFETTPLVITEEGEHTLRMSNVENPIEYKFWVFRSKAS